MKTVVKRGINIGRKDKGENERMNE